MRKILMILMLLAVPVLAAPVVSAPAQAATAAPSEQELLVIKKKKAEAARKALAAKKTPAAKVVARQPAGKNKLVTSKRVRVMAASTTSRAPALPRNRAAAGRSCDGFLSCLFGKRTNPNIRKASTAPSGSSGRDVATSEVVSWAPGSKYAPGSLVVRTPERSLYLVMGDGQARRYKVGVGREGFQWSGNSRIVAKQEWPTWHPPQVMIEREAAKGHMLPEMMEGGPENPLGARALYIGGTMFRIHGTNNAASIGGAVSSGCIRMMNTDVVDLYDRVKVGAKVYVYQ
jgi:lipoprotein-anchoring transpeptidase ErfK/SrfK